ncbi:hypothetical protein C8R47DRAFT_1244472 [Mycena vitilis]|nr:hypothetical protein C8R47DRAFT_1244472 [Mycena vitilis]
MSFSSPVREPSPKLLFDESDFARSFEWLQPCPSPPPRTGIFETWYNDPNILNPWSTDWNHWEGIVRYIRLTTYDDERDKFEKLVEVFELPGKIEPLAFIPGMEGDVFLFASGSEFYMWINDRLMAHRMAFTSTEEFLKHALQPSIGGRSNLPDVELAPTSGPEYIDWM